MRVEWKKIKSRRDLEVQPSSDTLFSETLLQNGKKKVLRTENVKNYEAISFFVDCLDTRKGSFL